MEVGYYSVEASVIENGKTIKGTLTLFYDEYAFGSTTSFINVFGLFSMWNKPINPLL